MSKKIDLSEYEEWQEELEEENQNYNDKMFLNKINKAALQPSKTNNKKFKPRKEVGPKYEDI